MTIETFGLRLFLGGAALAALAIAPAAAAPVALSTELVYDGDALDENVSGPRLGANGSEKYVVFQVNPVGPFGAGPGIITLQRLTHTGAPSGSPQVIGRNITNETNPDGSENYVVYLSDDDADGNADSIRLYDISTSLDFFVADTSGAPGTLNNPRISGDWIVWDQQFDATNGSIFGTRISEIGTGTPPTTIRGPVPASGDPDVDSRFIVWTEQVTSFGFDKEVRAQEIGGSSFFVTPDDVTDGFDEILPATWNSLIAFGLVDTSTGLADIVLRDILADTTTTFSLGLEGLSALSLSGEFLAFNAFDISGVTQAFVLSLLDGGVLQLTSGPGGGEIADIFDDSVSYTSGKQLFVAQLGEEVSEVPLPSAFIPFGMGLFVFAALRRRQAIKSLGAAAIASHR